MISDESYMHRALELAQTAGIRVTPNPMVGAVIVHNDVIIGEGSHMEFGGPHAEVNAVRSVKDQGILKEATIYVTLEPCAHHGKTPPCADLLVEKGFKKVVIGCRDPFEKVAGKGIEILQNAGIEVITGILEKECRELNKRFFTFHMQNRPYVTLKWAQTADGFIDGERTEGETGINWITQPETQVFTHSLRANEQGILAGWKTIQTDNPSLTVRAVSGKDPVRIIIDPQLRSSPESKVYTDGDKTFVINLLRSGIHSNIHYIQPEKITPENILRAIWELGISSILIEGGPTTLQQFIDAKLWDETFIITGDAKFGKGIFAPHFHGSLQSSRTFGKDIINHYLPV